MVFAQSLLPICPSAQLKNNCRSESLFSDGGKYVGEFVDSKFEGQGIEYDRNGSVRRSGFWKEGRLYRSQFISPSDFPFHKDTSSNTTSLVESSSQSGNLIRSNLPPCPQASLKTNCWGEAAYRDGRKYVGEFLNFKFHGKGIEFNSDGSVLRSGSWSQGNFVGSTSIQQATDSNQSVPSTGAQADNAERGRLLAEVEAERKKRQELEEQLRLARLQSQVSPPSSMTTMANRKALVIGNDTYKSVSKLLNAREDAKAIASNLTAVGYKVTLQLDLNEKEMKAALRTFSSQVQGGDEVMFFFAGHGVQLGATNYLLPTDIGGESEAQVKDEAIQLQRVLDDMTEKKAKFTLAMIDACRDNPFKSMGRNIGGRGLAPTTAATGQMVVFSAGSGQQALDRLGSTDKNKNGVFTRTFLKEMQKSGVSIDRIVKNVRNEVAELAKTIGHEQVPAIYDQVLGDFYFKK